MFLTILFLIFSLGQLGRISLFENQINFYTYEILLAAFLIYLVQKLKLTLIRNSYKKFKWIYWFILSLFLSLLVSFYKFSFFQNTVAVLYFLRLTSYFLFFLYFQFYFSSKLKTDYRRSILILSLITLIFSFTQYFFYPNLRNLYYLGWDPHQYRIFGLFFEPSIAASIFGLILIFLIQSEDILNRKVKTALLVLYSVLGLLTYSRGFYFAASLTAIIFLIRNRLYKQILIFLIILSFSILILPKPFGEGVNLSRTITVQSRILDYQEGINIWKGNPIFGIGYNHLPYVKITEKKDTAIPDHSDSAFHSSFLTILATGGILGLILFLSVLFYFGKISETASYYTIFLSVFSLTDNIILQPFVLFFFLYLLVKEVNLSRKLR